MGFRSLEFMPFRLGLQGSELFLRFFSIEVSIALRGFGVQLCLLKPELLPVFSALMELPSCLGLKSLGFRVCGSRF